MPDARNRFQMMKPYRQQSQMNREDAVETWGILGKAMNEIQNRNASQLSFEELYRYAYNLVLHKHGAVLYDGVRAKITEHLESAKDTLVAMHTEPSLLDGVAQTWDAHKVTMKMICDILMYMDRTYIRQHKRRSVNELGLHLFRIVVWEDDAVKKRVGVLVLEAIARERNGFLADNRVLLKQIIGMLLEIGHADYAAAIYQEDFEEAFLGSTKEFYHTESLHYLSQNTAADYVRKATSRIEEEKERSTFLQLPSSTESSLSAIVLTEWIERHARTLVDLETTGFSALLNDDTKLEDMRLMYDLFSRAPQSLDHLRDAMSDAIKLAGRKLVADQTAGNSDASTFVRGVLSLRDRYENVVEVSFRGEKKTAKKMRESFEDFLNADARAASCLAVYVDKLLQAGLRGATDDQMNKELAKVIVIFRYLSDKDVFESFYKQHLAKRLLGNRSASDDAERAMVSLLKAECGYQFTTKLEGMFNDMRISRETRNRYRAHTSSRTRSFEMEVDVLTAGYWPSQNVSSCTLPKIVQDSIDNFSEFYLGEHTGRRLSWQTSAGSAELKACFGGKRYELLLSTYQMCILLLFNENTTLTLGQIRSHTHIPDSELRRHLISLTTKKHRILTKGSTGKGITSDDDKFTFNEKYTSKQKRIRILLVKESSMGNNAPPGADAATAPRADGVPVAVEEDRRHLVEAAIVRIMKARKTLSHNDLIAEVTRQLHHRFSATPKFIKKRIEGLLDREYLERSLQNSQMYEYVA